MLTTLPIHLSIAKVRAVLGKSTSPCYRIYIYMFVTAEAKRDDLPGERTANKEMERFVA